MIRSTLIDLSNVSAADQINDRVEKSIKNPGQHKEKSISFATPLSPVKSNEIGEKFQAR